MNDQSFELKTQQKPLHPLSRRSKLSAVLHLMLSFSLIDPGIASEQIQERFQSSFSIQNVATIEEDKLLKDSVSIRALELQMI